MDPVERLRTGFEKFKTEVYDQKPDLFEPLKAHQSPKYMVFACADSRVCPSVTLGLEPGEAFMPVRRDQGPAQPQGWRRRHIPLRRGLVRIGFPARKKVKDECSEMPFEDQCGVLEKEAVNVSLQNLSTYLFVKEGVANGTLAGRRPLRLRLRQVRHMGAVNQSPPIAQIPNIHPYMRTYIISKIPWE
ncbi:hypothetical protein ZWY2020_010342 [Hordeum vulgare]|nr:hypothetical protein ZWY2020_010342 [Hordeum vulgare]